MKDEKDVPMGQNSENKLVTNKEYSIPVTDYNLSELIVLNELVQRANSFYDDIGTPRCNKYPKYIFSSGRYDIHGGNRPKNEEIDGVPTSEFDRVFRFYPYDENHKEHIQTEINIPVRFFSVTYSFDFGYRGTINFILNRLGAIRVLDEFADELNVPRFKMLFRAIYGDEYDKMDVDFPGDIPKGLPKMVAKNILRLSTKHMFYIANEKEMARFTENLPEDDSDLVNYLEAVDSIKAHNAHLHEFTHTSEKTIEIQ